MSHNFPCSTQWRENVTTCCIGITVCYMSETVLSDGQRSHKTYSYNHTPPTYSKQTCHIPPPPPPLPTIITHPHLPFPPSSHTPTSPFHHHHTPPPPLPSTLVLCPDYFSCGHKKCSLETRLPTTPHHYPH